MARHNEKNLIQVMQENAPYLLELLASYDDTHATMLGEVDGLETDHTTPINPTHMQNHIQTIKHRYIMVYSDLFKPIHHTLLSFLPEHPYEASLYAKSILSNEHPLALMAVSTAGIPLSAPEEALASTLQTALNKESIDLTPILKVFKVFTRVGRGLDNCLAVHSEFSEKPDELGDILFRQLRKALNTEAHMMRELERLSKEELMIPSVKGDTDYSDGKSVALESMPSPALSCKTQSTKAATSIPSLDLDESKLSEEDKFFSYSATTNPGSLARTPTLFHTPRFIEEKPSLDKFTLSPLFMNMLTAVVCSKGANLTHLKGDGTYMAIIRDTTDDTDEATLRTTCLNFLTAHAVSHKPKQPIAELFNMSLILINKINEPKKRPTLSLRT